ncbi:hypothetical protein PV325_004129 [Microctonus aethiopoides]|nr:hypothetical protein PV325_004129 [Microctonus aethiopoides]KAK0098825.1 hypothetical protein PV326_002456 [Microctonus aethiopoides]
MCSNFTVTSEIHTENCNEISSNAEEYSIITAFSFIYPRYMAAELKNNYPKYDEDDDLIVNRKKEGKLLIEHSISTELKFVGLQVWRGALLLADYILANPKIFEHKTILELGSGVGLTSIVASFLANEVICTDINLDGILEMINRNVQRNSEFVRAKLNVMALDFLNCNWSTFLIEKLTKTTIILAADVIYDIDITKGFVNTLEKLLGDDSSRTAYIALEKRYVFTINDLDSVAPMYEEFLRSIVKQNLNWNIKMIDLDFPQYFHYDRVKQMILMKIQKQI